MKIVIMLLAITCSNCFAGSIAIKGERANTVTLSLPWVKIAPTTKRKPVLVTDGFGRKIWATLTTYWSKGAGSDYWTRRGMTSTGAKLRRGVVAVDPRVIPYGSRLTIPGLGNVIALDTGSAVVARTASIKNGNRCNVIDVWFPTRKEALRHWINL